MWTKDVFESIFGTNAEVINSRIADIITTGGQTFNIAVGIDINTKIANGGFYKIKEWNDDYITFETRDYPNTNELQVRPHFGVLGFQRPLRTFLPWDYVEHVNEFLLDWP